MPHFALQPVILRRRSFASALTCALVLASAGLVPMAAGAVAPGSEPAPRAGSAAGIRYEWVGTATTGEARAQVRSHPSQPEGYLALAGAAWRAGDFTAAAKALEKGRAKAPRDSRLMIALGSVYAEQGRLADAEAVTQDAVHVDPRGADALYQLGVLQALQNRTEEAAASFQQVLTLAPGLAPAQCRLLQALTDEGHAAMAEEICRRFLDGTPQRSDLWIALGETLEAQEKGQEAFAAYGKALTLDPRSAGAHSRRARLFCRFTQYEAAQFECRAALQLDPEDALAHACLGIACAHLGQKDEARREALKAQKAGLQVEEVWDVIGRP